jgi:DNA polymerase III subunit chi
MAIIRFYELTSARFSENPLLLVAKLVEKSFEQSHDCAILVNDNQQAEALDDLLWSYAEDAFLPHQIAGQADDDDESPILIVTPEFSPPARAVTINLRDAMIAEIGERLLEIIPQTETGKAKARERFKAYKARGENPSFEKV